MSYPNPFTAMKAKPDALERLELQFRWGDYGIRVLKWHLVTFPAGHVIPYHKHSEFEFHFIARGKGTVRLEDQAHRFNAGMFYLTGPEVLHQQEIDARDSSDELCLHVDIVALPPSEGEWGAQWERMEAEQCVSILRHMPPRLFLDLHDAMDCFLSAYQAACSEEIGPYTTIRQACIQILLRAAQAMADKERAHTLPSRDVQAHRLQLAKQYIQANYAMPITLQEVADILHISIRQLQRIFHHYGMGSFSHYLEDVRIRKICEALLQSADTVDAIARQHGYANSNYLHKVFKQRLGMTPLAYRDMYAISRTR